MLKSISELEVSQRPFILMEILPVYSLENKDRIDRQKGVERMMSSMNYSILRIVKRNNQFNNFKLLEELGTTTKIEESDYLFCPSEWNNTVLTWNS